VSASLGNATLLASALPGWVGGIELLRGTSKGRLALMLDKGVTAEEEACVSGADGSFLGSMGGETSPSAKPNFHFGSLSVRSMTLTSGAVGDGGPVVDARLWALEERVRDRNRALLASVALIPMKNGVVFCSMCVGSSAGGGGVVGTGDRVESGAAMLPNVTDSFLFLSSRDIAAT
jgi:hypothetical protein